MPLLEEAYRFAEQVLPKLPVSRDIPRAKSFTWSTLFDRDLSANKAAG
jgi:alkanesulfonate monooxygenase